MRNPPDELREFLSAFAPRVSKLFLATRGAVLAKAPESNELVYDAANAVTAAYTYSDRLKEAFCHVAAYSAHVNLGFNRGASLLDPDGMLEGSGTSIRHIRLTKSSELSDPALQALLHSAALEGRSLVETPPKQPTSIVRPTTGVKRRPK